LCVFFLVNFILICGTFIPSTFTFLSSQSSAEISSHFSSAAIGNTNTHTHKCLRNEKCSIAKAKRCESPLQLHHVPFLCCCLAWLALLEREGEMQFVKCTREME